MYLRKRKKKGEGFTLIELLIVIVIIGILVSIALPNFQAAQDRAKNASLESNMRTLSVIAQTYSVDWGGNVADNVTVLHNEATAKNYWKDLKNPFTGQSGLGFAISNYSQAVSLISFLQGVKLAEALYAEPVQHYKIERSYTDVAMLKNADLAYNKASEVLPSAEQAFSSEGQIGYWTDTTGTSFAIVASGKSKEVNGKRMISFLIKNGKPFVLASKKADQLAEAMKKASGSDSGSLQPAHENQELYNKIYESVKSEYSPYLDKINEERQALSEKREYYEKQLATYVSPELVKQQESLSSSLSELKDYRVASEQKIEDAYASFQKYADQTQEKREALYQQQKEAEVSGNKEAFVEAQKSLEILDEQYARAKESLYADTIGPLKEQITQIDEKSAVVQKELASIEAKINESSKEAASTIDALKQIQAHEENLSTQEKEILNKIAVVSEDQYNSMMESEEKQPVDGTLEIINQKEGFESQRKITESIEMEASFR